MVHFNGDLNTGLTLRTIRIKDGIAEVRAGATLLYDSSPEEEEAAGGSGAHSDVLPSPRPSLLEEVSITTCQLLLAEDHTLSRRFAREFVVRRTPREGRKVASVHGRGGEPVHEGAPQEGRGGRALGAGRGDDSSLRAVVAAAPDRAHFPRGRRPRPPHERRRPSSGRWPCCRRCDPRPATTFPSTINRPRR